MSSNGKPILQRTFQAPLETKEGRILEGCVVPYGEATKVADSEAGPVYYELFEPGCFRKQIKAADKIELRYEHGHGLADSVGICRALYEEASGLFGTFAVNLGAFGDQALELVRNKILPGFSVEFEDRFTHWQRSSEGTVVRRNCHLHSVGLVRQPAYAGAVITAQRSRAEIEAEYELPTVTGEQRDRLRAVGIEA